MADLEAVRKRAGMLLGIVAEPDSLRAEDDSLLSRIYDEVYDSLDREGLAEWSKLGSVPDAVVPHIAAIMAFDAAVPKKISGEQFNRILALRNVARPEIRRLMIPDYESVEPVVDY
jgi:hypothetical protein